jgi:diguanylate cyclase (GGDEF)-like protein
MTWYVKTDSDAVVSHHGSPCFEELYAEIERELDAPYRLDGFFQRIISERRYQNFRLDIDRRKILDYLKNHSAYLIFVPVLQNGSEVPYRIRVSKAPDREDCLLIDMRGTEMETREEQQIHELAQRLAEAYVAVDYIDLESDRVTCYEGNEDRKFRTGGDEPYSVRAKAYVEQHVVAEDREFMRAFADPALIREQLRSDGEMSACYRERRGSDEHYLEIRFLNANRDQDARHAIMTLTDVDAQIRREAERSAQLENAQKKLRETERRANLDALTGVKNIAAYTDEVEALTERMGMEKALEFAVVYCDINGLQKVNERWGQAAGDQCLRSCGKILGRVFRHSPVFRIGGDEFAVILKDVDLDARQALLKKLREEIRAAEQISDYGNGRVSFSAGMAVYDPQKDSGVSRVVKRAAKNMYRKED